MSAVDELLLKWANGDLTSSEKEELSQHYSMADLDSFIVDTGKLQIETSNVKTEWAKLAPQIQEGKLKRNSRNKYKFLTWLIPLVILIAVGVWYVISLGPDKKIENKTYEPMLIAMEDNTEIMLSPGSSLSYNKSKFAALEKSNLK